MTCLEVVIYQVKPDMIDQFCNLRNRVIAEMAQLDGFIREETHGSVESPTLFVDTLTWRDQSSALEAYARFNNLDGAAEFLACIQNVTFSGHFLPLSK